MSVLYPISGCENDHRRADVLFLHGLGGDASGTWRHGRAESTSWPHWLGEEFPDVGVWSLGYAASPTKWMRPVGSLFSWFSPRWRDAGHSMSLPDRAGQVLDLMVQRGFGQRPMLLICHSLGGLLAKQILRKAAEATESRKQAVAHNARASLFLATPHTGATLASLANAFRAVLGATFSMKDLRAHDPHLRDLYDWYRNHAAKQAIETCTYFELRGVRGVTIVNPSSSHPGVGADPVGLDEDHLSIAKPRERDAQVCGAARDLLRDHVLVARPMSRLTVAPPANPAAPLEVVVKLDIASLTRADGTRVPRELPAAADRFFGRKTQREQLTSRLQGANNTAVVGPAGMGKTALAAEAVAAVVGQTRETLAASPFPDGVVFLDLYTFHGEAEPVWNSLANKLAGADFRETKPARDRATEACRHRSLLVIIEGGEEADGLAGRVAIRDLLSVLSPENRWLLLTRDSTQAAATDTVGLKDALSPDDAARLFDSLTGGRVIAAVRERVLKLLEGHPLGLTWAGNLLARDDEDPARLAGDWEAQRLPALSDPTQAEHTLEWLFNRSVRGLDDTARETLAAAGLLARAPFPLAAIEAALAQSSSPTIVSNPLPLPRLGGEGRGEGSSPARESLRRLVQRGLLRRYETEADHWEFTHVLGYRFARKETGSDAGQRRRLAEWLHKHLIAALAVGTGPDVGLADPLQHAAALLRADSDKQLWQPLAIFLLYDAHYRLVSLGRLDWVNAALGAVSDWLDRFPTAKSAEPYWQRERSVCFNSRGDLATAQGNLPEAQRLFGESLRIAQRLAESDPANAAWQRDLSVSFSKLGDLATAQGNLPEAQRLFGEALRIAQRLAESDPANSQWQFDLGISNERLGDLATAQGNLDEARTYHLARHAIIQRLAESDPANAAWQRDLSVSFNKLGDLATAQGNLPEAQRLFGEDLRILQRLAESDPANAAWQRDLSVSFIQLGELATAHGNLPEAQRLFGESLRIAQQLAESDPANAAWQRDLSVSHHKLAMFAQQSGDDAGFQAESRECFLVLDAMKQRGLHFDPQMAQVYQQLAGIFRAEARLK